MEDDNSVSPSAGIMTDLSNATEITQNSLLNNSITAVDYSPDDEDLDDAAAAAEATRDTLADGLVASLLRPCVDRLDASVQSTRLSQLDLKVQLDSLAAELKSLSLAQHDYLLTTASLPSPQSPVAPDKTTSPTVMNKVAMDTCVLLDGHANRLSSARAKIAVVGNILESTQERLRALSHRIGREHNNRRSLLEPQAVQTNVVQAKESNLEGEVIEEFNFQDSDSTDIEDMSTDKINKVPSEDQELQPPIVMATSPSLS